MSLSNLMTTHSKKLIVIAELMLLSSIALHATLYQISKIILEASILLTTPLFILTLMQNKITVKDYLRISVLIVFLISYIATYLLSGSPTDYRHLLEGSTIITPLALLYFSLKYNNAVLLNRKSVTKTISLSIFLAFIFAVFKYIEAPELRYTIGTNLILIYAGTIALLCIFLLSLQQGKETFSNHSLLFFILGCFIIMYSGSRGAIISLILITLFILAIKLGYRSVKFVIGIITILCIMISFLEPIQKRFIAGSEQIKDILFDEDLKPNSISVRYDMYASAIRELTNDPITNRGSFSLEETFSEVTKDKINFETTLRFDHVHNDILHAWLTRGLLGLVSVMLILASPFLFITGERYRLTAIALTSTALLLGLTDSLLIHAFFLKIYVSLIITLGIIQHKTSRPYNG